MADPIQTARIVEAMAKVICAAFEDSTPEFAEMVWAQQEHPDEEVRAIRRRDVAEYTATAQAALSTAYPMIREEMARIAEATQDWQDRVIPAHVCKDDFGEEYTVAERS